MYTLREEGCTLTNVHPPREKIDFTIVRAGVHWPMYTHREEGCTLTNVYPPGGGGGIDQYPSGLAIYFSSYYNVNGITMARRYWRIPSSSFEVQAIPPPPSASPPEIGGIA